MRGLYFTSDLLFASRVTQAARRQGLEIEVLGSEQMLWAAAAADDVSLVILDLDRVGSDLQQRIAWLRQQSDGTAVVGYGPHVDAASLTAAQSAGCDLVLTRGQFDRQINQVLAQFLT
jgi:DNA-binding response OmpR family regulator